MRWQVPEKHWWMSMGAWAPGMYAHGPAQIPTLKLHVIMPMTFATQPKTFCTKFTVPLPCCHAAMRTHLKASIDRTVAAKA